VAAPLLQHAGLSPSERGFRHAYALVSSRAFMVDAYHGLAMVPIADAWVTTRLCANHKLINVSSVPHLTASITRKNTAFTSRFVSAAPPAFGFAGCVNGIHRLPSRMCRAIMTSVRPAALSQSALTMPTATRTYLRRRPRPVQIRQNPRTPARWW